MKNNKTNDQNIVNQVSILPLPILSAEKFADAVGLPIGVVEAQLDRRQLPVLKIGKRRFINMELLRQTCLSGFNP